MRKLIFLIVLLISFSIAALVWAWSNITPQDAGYVVVTDYDGVDPTGATDSTAGLQAAINAARDSFKPLFFPNQDDNSQAIYTVNATLFARAFETFYNGDRGEAARKRCVLVGSRKGGHRPIIRLADNTFTDVNDTQPVLWFWQNCNAPSRCTQEQHDAEDPLNNQIDVNLYAQIRGIDFDLGNNPGAIAISFGTAQGSMISNLSINATNAYAGIENAGVLGPAVYDVEIDGGRYAFLLDSTDWLFNPGHPAYFGVQCYDQTHAVIYSAGDIGVPILFTGFHFRNNSAIPVLDGTYSAQSAVCFVDGVIDINATAGFDILQFDTDRSVYMRNVYTKGIDNIEGNNITDTTNWCWVKEMSVMRRGSDEHNLVDGNNTHSGEVWAHEEGKTYTETQLIESLVDFHTWDYWTFPTFETTGAINIIDAPYSANVSSTNFEDDYNATQTALNDAAPDGVVFIPTGRLALSHTLTLPKNVSLIGASQPYTVIRPLYSWQPDVSSGTPILQTDDNASAAPKLAHLNIGAYWEDYERDGAIDTHNGKTDQFQFYSILWRAGADSQVVNVNFAKAGDWEANTVTKFPFIKVTNNGGGKWYGIHGKTHHDFSLQERADMLIENTDIPMYIYGFNSHEDGPDYGIKIENSDNKFVYHFHAEGGETSFRAYNGNNVGLFEFGKNNDISTGTNRAHVEFEDCTNATMVFRYSGYTPPSNTGFREDYFGTVNTFTGFMGLFKRGDPEYLEVGGITPPTVTTQAVTDIGGNNATGHATITDLGGDSNCTKRGVCWDTGPNPTIENNKAEESGGFDTGAFSANMTGLSCGQHYYVRGYAYNSSGYGYGEQVEFDTSSCPAGPNKRRMSGMALSGVSIE